MAIASHNRSKMKIKKLTINKIRAHFKTNGYTSRHSFNGLKHAANKVSEEIGLDPYDILLLVIEDKPIEGGYTHYYGFHTDFGRHLIESFSEYYYSFIN